MASRLFARLGALGAISCCFAIGQAQIIWDESVNGDLSGDRFNPTSLSLGVGNNEVIATMGPDDKEYVHFSLAPGTTLSQIILVSYSSVDPISFIGVQAGTTFTESPEAPNVENILGYTLFGDEHIGTDILPAIGSGPGSIGFTPPLTGGDYTFWIQQTGDPTDYRLNFVTTPEPATISLGIGAALVMLRRRKSRKA